MMKMNSAWRYLVCGSMLVVGMGVVAGGELTPPALDSTKSGPYSPGKAIESFHLQEGWRSNWSHASRT